MSKYALSTYRIANSELETSYLAEHMHYDDLRYLNYYKKEYQNDLAKLKSMPDRFSDDARQQAMFVSNSKNHYVGALLAYRRKQRKAAKLIKQFIKRNQVKR